MKFIITPYVSPCRGCQQRHIHCHGECALYIEYSQQRRDEYERRAKEKQLEYDLNCTAQRKRKLYNRKMKRK